MKHFEYATSPMVCSRKIAFDLDEEQKVHNLVFTSGCNGNLKAIGKLCEGRTATEVINTLKGNTCGMRSTSCADQLAIALEKALSEN